MTNIVERLDNLLQADPDPAMCELYATCKAEIERLRREAEQHLVAYQTMFNDNEQLRSALEQAIDDFGEGHCVCEQTKQECIRALENKP